ncbi:MAG: hypothetical protein NTZ22_10680, partial [Hyphomicrobiales bacterium]|nr:hypothetical protein [Hyphomicrobiales bacterium]
SEYANKYEIEDEIEYKSCEQESMKFRVAKSTHSREAHKSCAANCWGQPDQACGLVRTPCGPNAIEAMTCG